MQIVRYSKAPGLLRGTPVLSSSYQLGPSAVLGLYVKRIGLEKKRPLHPQSELVYSFYCSIICFSEDIDRSTRVITKIQKERCVPRRLRWRVIYHKFNN